LEKKVKMNLTSNESYINESYINESYI
jgi:hypothetical protein